MSLPLRITGVVAACAAAAPLVARAEEAAGGNMLPQMDPAFYPSQLFWLLVSFVLLYVLLRGSALPKITAVQESRRTVLEEDLSQAAQDNAEAKSVLAELERDAAEQRQRVQALRVKAQADASTYITEGLTLQALELAQRVHHAEAALAARKDEVRAALSTTAAELAAAMAERVAGLTVDAGMAGRAVRQALDDTDSRRNAA